jgi:hypothetical protein
VIEMSNLSVRMVPAILRVGLERTL